MFNLIRRVSSGIWSRTRPPPDSEPSTDAPLVGSKRRRDADDDANTVMQVDDFGQRKRARSKEPDSDVPDTPTGSHFINPIPGVADAADAARDASPFPISRSQSATDSVREQTEAVKNVTLGVKEVDIEDTAATQEETALPEVAAPNHRELATSEVEAADKVESAKEETPTVTSTETLTLPTTTPASANAVASQEVQKVEEPVDSKTNADETTASPASVVSDSETSTAVAPGDTVEPIESSKVVEVDSTTEESTEDTSAVIRSSASPEPMTAASKS